MVDLAVVGTAYSVASALGASPTVMLSLFEAALVESGFRNLPYGDRDSVGYLQQRPSQGWPDPMDVATATRSYVTRAKRNAARHPDYTAGQLAQSVQISAYPDRYDKREREARELLARARLGDAPDAVSGAIGGVDIQSGGLVESVMGIADGVRTMAGGAVNVGALAAQLAKLALPSNVTRAVTGVIGIVFVFSGIVIIGRQIK